MTKRLNIYQIKMNKALRFINDNLDQKIRIADLAEVSHFSLFHFQRLYKAMQMETPYDTILRLRL